MHTSARSHTHPQSLRKAHFKETGRRQPQLPHLFLFLPSGLHRVLVGLGEQQPDLSKQASALVLLAPALASVFPSVTRIAVPSPSSSQGSYRSHTSGYHRQSPPHLDLGVGVQVGTPGEQWGVVMSKGYLSLASMGLWPRLPRWWQCS